jgi:hypothetical protein
VTEEWGDESNGEEEEEEEEGVEGGAKSKVSCGWLVSLGGGPLLSCSNPLIL